MTDRNPDKPTPTPAMQSDRPLHPGDALCIDALLNEGDAGGVDLARSARVSAVLSLLERDASSQPAPAGLVERTLMKVASSRPATLPVLSSADASLLDAVIEARAKGNAWTPVLADDRDRLVKLQGVLSLLDRDAAESSSSSSVERVNRTIAAVDGSRQRDRFAQQIEMMRLAPPTRGIGVSWRQLAGAAAVFLLGVSVLLPTLERTRAEANRAACMSNLAMAGQAFGSYAADYAGMLPRGRSVAGSPWWNVGRPDAVDRDGNVYSNSAHLYRLVRTRYIDADRLACATNASAPHAGQMTVHQLDWSTPMAISYSYQNQFTPEPIRVHDAPPTLAVLADKNPLFVVRDGRVAFDADAPLTSQSVLHGGRGQNVLKIDGSAGWHVSPVMQHASAGVGSMKFQSDEDNIWSVFGIDRYQGNETPSQPTHDAFLVP